MLRKRHAAEEIVSKLRQADVLLAQGHFLNQRMRDYCIGNMIFGILAPQTPAQFVDQRVKLRVSRFEHSQFLRMR